MTINPKNLFLVDSLGALLSASMLGLVLANFEQVFGMPRHILYFLSFIALGFAIYSFICYRYIKKNKRTYLEMIAIANLGYCVLTLVLVIYYRLALTPLGWTWFLLEAAVVIALVFLELKTAFRWKG